LIMLVLLNRHGELEAAAMEQAGSQQSSHA